MEQYFKSILEQDPAPVVVCDRNHTILYMNPAAAMAYEKQGGFALLGKNVLACHNPRSREAIEKILAWFGKDPANNCVHTAYLPAEALDLYMVALRAEDGTLIGYYERYCFRTRDDSAFYDMK